MLALGLCLTHTLSLNGWNISLPKCSATWSRQRTQKNLSEVRPSFRPKCVLAHKVRLGRGGVTLSTPPLPFFFLAGMPSFRCLSYEARHLVAEPKPQYTQKNLSKVRPSFRPKCVPAHKVRLDRGGVTVSTPPLPFFLSCWDASLGEVALGSVPSRGKLFLTGETKGSPFLNAKGNPVRVTVFALGRKWASMRLRLIASHVVSQPETLAQRATTPDPIRTLQLSALGPE
ncbi:hypothetical protein AXG93_4877s1080 [Marchantia polymorpha subsp. ruderalis]|uniref:Uncharacterized protein n=1 Tax=Marchantia polymorpha subsp. ruderalis TaxID=1480154 RepID=A0A176WEJ3_MARPO|nr:hypothetical protein AXG93_4877s1080 [Marchantia polymorpha subsp. ruderalis]